MTINTKRKIEVREKGEHPTDAYLETLSASLRSAAAELGRKGWLAKSERKAKSSAANGLKGGRPRKNTL